jgi:hypothetical protein
MMRGQKRKKEEKKDLAYLGSRIGARVCYPKCWGQVTKGFFYSAKRQVDEMA